MGKRAVAEPGAVRLRVVSDERYVIGIPAEVGHEFDVEAAAAPSLMETGLYEVVSGTPAVTDDAADGAAGGSDQ